MTNYTEDQGVHGQNGYTPFHSLIEMTQLNINTLNKMMGNIQSATHLLGKAENFPPFYAEIIKKNSEELMNYSQELMHIFRHAFLTSFHTMSNKVAESSDTFKSAMNEANSTVSAAMHEYKNKIRQ
jgi:hypothetical protein